MEHPATILNSKRTDPLGSECIFSSVHDVVRTLVSTVIRFARTEEKQALARRVSTALALCVSAG